MFLEAASITGTVLRGEPQPLFEAPGVDAKGLPVDPPEGPIVLIGERGIIDAVDLEVGHDTGSRTLLSRPSSGIAGTSHGVRAMIAGGNLPT
jgi:hypothetical protein